MLKSEEVAEYQTLRNGKSKVRCAPTRLSFAFFSCSCKTGNSKLEKPPTWKLAAFFFSPQSETVPIVVLSALGSVPESIPTCINQLFSFRDTSQFSLVPTSLVLKLLSPEFPTEKSDSTVNCSMKQQTILLVEDDDDMRTLYGFMLASGGYHVKAVRNGLEALAEIQITCPDVVVTDLAMPLVSGLDLIKAIKSNKELVDLPIIAMTSFGENLRELARAVGANEAIDKPGEEEKLRHVISDVLGCLKRGE